LILWSKLTLAGKLCKDYKIKDARSFYLNPKLIIPNWTETELPNTAGMEEIDKNRLWSQTWRDLNWKHRPDEQYESYWYLLHKRSRRFKVGYNPENFSERKWTIITCGICKQKDTHQHAYFHCPEVRKIWKSGLSVLAQITGRTDLQATIIDFPSILLAFPDLRRRLPKNLKARVLLWHSAIVHLIWKRRNQAMHLQNTDPDTTEVPISFREPHWKPELYASLRASVTQIFYNYRSRKLQGSEDTGQTPGDMQAFIREWGDGCALWGVETNYSLQFTVELYGHNLGERELNDQDEENESDESVESIGRERGKSRTGNRAALSARAATRFLP
jgi:hypothetical protein